MIKYLTFLFIFLFFPSSVFATNAVIINQIRGTEECCQPGTTKLIEAFNGNKDLQDLPVGWAVRYDALDNSEMISLLKDGRGEVGGLLEVTPQLTKNSNVSYKGEQNGYDWHFGKNVFLVGYTIDQRKKLIDTYFEKFKRVFGKYPSFTVSWMIDSWSLDYVSSKYNVILHELTKEQYETDSYTLYGGIFNAPYYPSKTHPLIPSKSGNSIVMIRQTISDPLYNYGFPKAFYTSQPNDYLSNTIDAKNISYFNSLVNHITDQKSGFPLAVVGFENSFDFQKYGQEFIDQLLYLKTKQTDGLITLKTPSETALQFKSEFKENKPFVIQDKFNSNANFGTLWYFSPYYRARLIVKNGIVTITDLRNNSDIDDPYRNDPLITDYGYYIIPYLIDGSQQYSLPNNAKNELEQKELSTNIVSDLISDPYGIILGSGPFTTISDEGIYTIKFQNPSGSVQLRENEIVIDKSLGSSLHLSRDYLLTELRDLEKNKQIKIPIDKHFDFTIDNGDWVTLGYHNLGTVPIFTILDNGKNLSLQPYRYGVELNTLASMYQPDKSNLPVDPEKSIFYWNNISATVNRNPVRLFILPLNKIGRPTKVSSVNISFSNDYGISTVYPQDYTFRTSPWFIDISSSRPLVTNISVTVDGKEVISNQKLFFLPNCKQNPISCLTSAKDVIQYITYKISEFSARLFPAPQL